MINILECIHVKSSWKSMSFERVLLLFFHLLDFCSFKSEAEGVLCRYAVVQNVCGSGRFHRRIVQVSSSAHPSEVMLRLITCHSDATNSNRIHSLRVCAALWAHGRGLVVLVAIVRSPAIHHFGWIIDPFATHGQSVILTNRFAHLAVGGINVVIHKLSPGHLGSCVATKCLCASFKFGRGGRNGSLEAAHRFAVAHLLNSLGATLRANDLIRLT